MTTTVIGKSRDEEEPPDDAASSGTNYVVRTGAFLAAMVAATIYLLFSPSRSSPDGALEDGCALTLIWIASVPVWQFFVSRRRTTPFFPAICAIYAIYFGLPRFNTRPLFGTEKWEPPASSVAPALAIALLGVTALIAGYYASGPFFRRLPRVTRAVDLARALPIFMIGASISILLRLATARLQIPMSLGQPLLVTQAIGQMCMGGMLLAHLRGLLSPWQLLFLLLAVVTELLSGVATGLLANALWPAIGLLFVYSWERRRLPTAFLAAMVIAFVPMNAAKHEFRANYGLSASDVASQSVLQRVSGFASVTIHTIEKMPVSEMLDFTGGRLGQLATLAVVVYQTPSRVPYWDGYSYQDLLWHFIPRLLVPSKPIVGFGQEFPRRYGLIDYANVDTAFNCPQLVEFYANFGVAGVAAGMFLIGAIYKILDRSFVVNTGGVLIGTTVFARLLNVESDFADVFGGVPPMLLALYVFVRLVPGEKSD